MRRTLRALLALVAVALSGQLAVSEALDPPAKPAEPASQPAQPPADAELSLPTAAEQAELRRLLAVHGAEDMDALFAKALEMVATEQGAQPRASRARRSAHALLRPLAAHGHAGAQARVGAALLLGEDEGRDVERALRLLRGAAARGNEDAQQQLGLLHALGLGVDADPALAVTFYYFAAEGGSAAAQLALGYRHLHGVDVPKDCQRAVMYFNPVAERVVADSQRAGARGLIFEKARLTDASSRNGGGKLLGDDDDVIGYYQYSAERGSADAQLTLGQLAFHGARGLPHDPALALQYYMRAAEGGEPAAHAHIGHMLMQGVGAPQDNATALRHFQMGAARGNPACQNGLGYMHLHGYGVQPSAAKALELFRAAADKGNPEAQFNLGAMHVSGTGLKRAYDKALHYFTLAAHQGHTLALYNLGQMHLHGLGAPRSCSVAAQFLKAVAERGAWGAALERAFAAFAREADSTRAALLYAPLAEAGYEVAQANLGFVSDAAVRRAAEASALPLARSVAALALEMFSRAARQGNVEAQLKIGDYHFYGQGTKVSARAVARPPGWGCRFSRRGPVSRLAIRPSPFRTAQARTHSPASALPRLLHTLPLRAGGPRAGGGTLPHRLRGAERARHVQPRLHARARARAAARFPPGQAALRHGHGVDGRRHRARQGARRCCLRALSRARAPRGAPAPRAPRLTRPAPARPPAYVQLALCELYAMQFFDELRHSAAVQRLRQSAPWQLLSDLVVVDGALQWDTAALALLSPLLLLVLLIRRRRAQAQAGPPRAPADT